MIRYDSTSSHDLPPNCPLSLSPFPIPSLTALVPHLAQWAFTLDGKLTEPTHPTAQPNSPEAHEGMAWWKRISSSASTSAS